MTVLIALLRGVNVGGRTKVPMADLRDLATELGYGDARTYIQSGNLLCTTSTSPAAVKRALERGIAERCRVDTDVIVRTRADLAKVVRGNPFVARGEDAAHLHVVFVDGTARVGVDDPARFAPEEVIAKGRELYLLLPGGVGRSKLAAALAKAKGPAGTMRNLRTVEKLRAMADELA